MNPDGDDDAVPGSPVPVPSVEPVGALPGVTDEDRNRYGVLLDHAAERGLLSPAEYQARLVELADATSVDQLQRIVTELPAFGSAGPAPAVTVTAPRPVGGGPSPRGRVSGDVDAALWASRTPSVARRSRGNPWVVLLVVVAVLVVALVALALVAVHYSHTHPAGLAPAAGTVFSRLRP